ncbi:ankyrin repeat-containing domain protein [Trichoderma barbatum]
MMEETPASKPDDLSIRKAPDDSSGYPDAAIDEILLSIDKNLQLRVVNSLKWLAFSFDPLTIDLLTEMFALQPDRTALVDEAEKLFPTQNVLEILSGLVIVDENHVRLADSSIKEYLTSSRISHSPASAFSFTETEAHLQIAQSCLTHHLRRNPPGLQNEDQSTFERKTYAAQNWPLHLEMVPRSSWPLETVQVAILALSIRSPSLLSMIVSLTTRPFLSSDAWVNPLIYTAYLGATQLTDMLVSEGHGTHEYITQWDLDTALLSASSAGKSETIRFLLDKGAGVDAEKATCLHPLREASENGHAAVVRFMLEYEAAAAGLRDSAARKLALHAAAKANHFDIIELLVRNGAEVDEYTLKAVVGISRDEEHLLECLQFLLDNSNDITKEAALCKAAFKGNWKAFELLLSRGADINAMGSSRGNPLHIACAAQDVDESRVEYLLSSGADPTIQDEGLGTALQAICYSFYGRDEDTCIKIAKLLMARGIDINAQGGEHGSALKNACASRGKGDVCWYNMVELLLKNGADVNAKGGPYGNALQVACHIGNWDLVPLLLAWGADVNAQGGAFSTALLAACFKRPKQGERGDIAMLQLLLDHGADVNAASSKVFGTAFHAACAAGNMELIRVLLDNGAKIDLQSTGYGTPLQFACQWGHTETVRFLLDNGADANELGRSAGGRFKTALDIAFAFTITRNKDEIVHLLLDHGADIHAPRSSFGPIFHVAASSDGIKDNAVLLRLLELGADMNQVEERTGTALHCVLLMSPWSQDTKLSRIRLLIEHGADVHLAAGELGSPLHCICAAPMNKPGVYINERSTILLLEICPEIDVNAPGGEYGSALQAAAWSGQEESIRLLIRKGAHVNALGGKYRSALNAAIIMGHWNIVRILLENGAKPDFFRQTEQDEDWLAEVQRECGRAAVERYRKFWNVEKRKLSAEKTQIAAL